MEISSTVLEQALGGVNELALPVAGASCLYLMLRRQPLPAAAAPRSTRRGRALRRGVSILGLAMTIGSPAVAAGRRHPSPTAVATGVRTEPGRLPPPRLPGSAGPFSEDPPWEDRGTTVTVHPAVHRRAHEAPSDAPTRLFRREAPPPAGHTRPSRDRLGWHAVLPGETLWSIAADRLHTQDVRRIARYWPRIHRANRDVLGSNPNLIHPGQVLELPPEEA